LSPIRYAKTRPVLRTAAVDQGLRSRYTGIYDTVDLSGVCKAVYDGTNFWAAQGEDDWAPANPADIAERSNEGKRIAKG
jgi:hypothetical protein